MTPCTTPTAHQSERSISQPLKKDVRELSFRKLAANSEAESDPKSKAVAKKTTKLLEEYFDGDITAVSRIPVDPIGTDFQKQVWKTSRQIKGGKAICYSDLAKRVGNPKATRAVAQALGKKPCRARCPLPSNHWQGSKSDGL